MKQLPSRPSKANTPRDSFVKVFLLPDEKHSHQTKVRHRSNNPVFNETFSFQVTTVLHYFLLLVSSVCNFIGLRSSRGFKKTLKNGIHSFPARCSAHRDSVENKPASLLVVSLGKALNGMPPFSCGRQVAGPSSLPIVVAQSEKRHANRA